MENRMNSRSYIPPNDEPDNKESNNKPRTLYQILEIIPTSTSKEVLLAYENKITKYNHHKKLNEDDIADIKMLKVALYILINNTTRKKYDTQLHKKLNKTQPIAGNQNGEVSLDQLFNVDNSWMNQMEINDDKKSKKNNIENNVISNRIFSMSEFQKRPNIPSDFEANIRIKQQGREGRSK